MRSEEKPSTEDVKFNETLQRMLKSPPAPHNETKKSKPGLTGVGDKKTGGPSVKKDRPLAS